VIFVAPAVACIAFGVYGSMPALVWIGAGITMYGAIYAGFHDIIVHRRIRHGWNPRSRYLKRIIQAHRLHHAVESKHGTVSFGFLWAPPVRGLLAELERRGVGKIRGASKVRREMDPGAHVPG
jgi:beta-carotene 3-hydroxylase